METHTKPAPALVQGNNWRDIVIDHNIVSSELVSVIIPYYQAKRKLDLVLTGLARQTYPRDLMEIIVVDDGSDPPLLAQDVPEDVRIVHQPRDGFGAARARNNGARVASGDIFVFVDGDMVLSPNNIYSHAKWHHQASNLYTTLADLRYLDENTTNLDEIEKNPRVNIKWLLEFLESNDYLTNGDDNIWATLPGPNFGIRKDSYWHIGGYIEDFKHWGLEDTHLTYRAYARGLILLPVIDTIGWHLGTPTSDQHRLSSALMEQYIPHRIFRDTNQRRIFPVPEYVVNIESSNPATLLSLVFDVLNGPPNDAVVRLDLSNMDSIGDSCVDGALYVKRRLEHDPRVRFGPSNTSLQDFPDSPFHVRVITNYPLKNGFVKQIRGVLGDNACLVAIDVSHNIRILRSWLAHRMQQYPDYKASADILKVIPAMNFTIDKINSVWTPSEYQPQKRTTRILGRIQSIRNSEGDKRAIEWIIGRVKHRIKLRMGKHE